MHTKAQRFIVVTGGPGSGKSTLLSALREQGYTCTVEAGRDIIKDQQAISGAALPWADRQLFAELILEWELRSYREADGCGSEVFFDRGVVDVIGYLRLEGLPIPSHVHRAAQRIRYHPTVFLAPYWPEIYRGDAQRWQSADLACRTGEAMVEAYREYGYTLVELPCEPVPERVRFMRDALGLPG